MRIRNGFLRNLFFVGFLILVMTRVVMMTWFLPGLIWYDIFWSEIVWGFGEQGGIPPQRIPGNTPRERNTHMFFMSFVVAEDVKGARIHSIINVIHFHNTFWLKALSRDTMNSFKGDEVYLKVLWFGKYRILKSGYFWTPGRCCFVQASWMSRIIILFRWCCHTTILQGPIYVQYTVSPF